MLKKRTMKLGAYDTAAYSWTLTSWKLTDPEQKTNYVEKYGGDGSWDLSTVMTEGIPRYKTRNLTATFECSEETREWREILISDMVNTLDGIECQIVLPDHEEYYLIGRVHVAVDYNDLAHAAVTVTATCEPWLYSRTETIIVRTATAAAQTVTLSNRGRRAVVPELVLTGSLLLVYGTSSISLSAGTYQWPTLLLTSGNHVLQYSGEGTLTINYREAVLR